MSTRGLQCLVEKTNAVVWYGHVNRVEDGRLTKNVMQCVPEEKEDDYEIHRSKGVLHAISQGNLQNDD